MGRVACPGGSISSARLRAVARAVEERGGGFADVTTRRDLLLQLPDTELAALQESAPELEREGACDDSPADPVGVHEQRPGVFAIGIPLVAGRVSAEQLAKAADLAERHADGRVRLTERQGILLLNVPQEKVVNVLEGLQSVELRSQGSMVRCGLTVCSQTDSCVEGWPDLSRKAREIVEHLERQLLLSEPLRIRVTGPSCACAVPSEEQIVLAGKQNAEGFDVRVGGRPLAEGVAGEEVKFVLERLLASWKRQREAGESLDAFCERVGREQVAQLLTETA